jgi:hypothetical protein
LPALRPIVDEALSAVRAASARAGAHDGALPANGGTNGLGANGLATIGLGSSSNSGHLLRLSAAADDVAAVWLACVRVCVQCPWPPPDGGRAAARLAMLDLLRRAVAETRQRSASLQALGTGWLCQHSTAARTFQLSPTLLAMGYTPLRVYETLVAKMLAEPRAPTTARASMTREVRNLFEAALADHGTHATKLWMRYAAAHAAAGEYAAASAVHARAMRTLEEPLRGPWLEEYQQRVLGTA